MARPTAPSEYKAGRSPAATGPFLLGAQPVYTDFALYGVLANLTYNDWNPFPPLPQLAEWFGRMKAFRFT